MSERKPWKITGAIAVILICAIVGNLHYMTNMLLISETDINAYVNSKNINQSRKQSIYRSILLNTGLWREWGLIDKAKINIYLSRIKSRQKDAVIIARGGNGKNVIALYEKHNGNYIYTAMIDTFSYLHDVQIMPLREQGGSLIVVRGRSGGSPLEEVVSVRAYAWDNGQFQPVLNITEKYMAYYNELWDKNKPASRSNWILIRERADIIWENADAPIVHVLLHQNYSLSKSVNQFQRPDKTDFEIVCNRDIMEEYIWSGKWMHFILFEGIDRQSGEPVAVIEDLSASSFGLLGQFNEITGKYRVKYLDGVIETVEKERIKPGIEVKKTRLL